MLNSSNLKPNTHIADLRRRPKGVMAPLRKEKANKKVHKLLLEGAKIMDYCLFNPTVEGA